MKITDCGGWYPRDNPAEFIDREASGKWRGIVAGGIVCRRNLISELMTYLAQERFAANRVKYIVYLRRAEKCPSGWHGNSGGPRPIPAPYTILCRVVYLQTGKQASG